MAETRQNPAAPSDEEAGNCCGGCCGGAARRPADQPAAKPEAPASDTKAP